MTILFTVPFWILGGILVLAALAKDGFKGETKVQVGMLIAIAAVSVIWSFVASAMYASPNHYDTNGERIIDQNVK